MLVSGERELAQFSRFLAHTEWDFLVALVMAQEQKGAEKTEQRVLYRTFKKYFRTVPTDNE